MTFEPSADFGLFVSGVGVDDVVDDVSGRDGALTALRKRMTPSGDAASCSVRSRFRQGMLSAANRVVVRVRVDMGHRPAFSALEREARLAVERLDLALLVDRCSRHRFALAWA
jgi:hypothetical protein